MRNNKYFIMAIIFACVTGLLIFQFLSSLNRRQSIVIASEDIRQYSLIDQTMIETKLIHPDSLQPGTFSNIQDLMGSYAVEEIVQGEHIISSNISSDESQKDFAGSLESQQRAIYIPLTLKHGLGGAVYSGDLVDIIFVSFDGQLGFNVSKTIMQKTIVLDVRDESGKTMDQSSSMASGIIIAATPQEAEKIAYCLENGNLYISRAPYGADSFDSEGIFYENIFRN